MEAKNKRPLKPINELLLIQMYLRDNVSITTLGKTFDIDKKRVRRILRRNGVEPSYDKDNPRAYDENKFTHLVNEEILLGGGRRKNEDKEIKSYIKKLGCEWVHGAYEDQHSPLGIRCICGEVFEASFNEIRSHGYTKCLPCRTEMDRRYVESVVERNGFTLCHDGLIYKNDRINVKCKNNHELETSIKIAENGNIYCKKCRQIDKKLKFYEEIKSYINGDNGNGCTLISGEVVSGYNDIVIKCNCGEEYVTTFSKFKKSIKKCRDCVIKDSRDKFGLTQDHVEKSVLEAGLGKYVVVGEYVNSKTKIDIQHLDCNKVFPMLLFAFIINEDRCPHCHISDGEIKVRDWFERNNKLYKREYSKDDLLSRKGFKLRVDFAVFDKNEDVEYFIECDGITHYKDIYKDGMLLNRQENDKIKNEYAKTNGIKMIRIPYWDYDSIEDILEAEIGR